MKRLILICAIAGVVLYIFNPFADASLHGPAVIKVTSKQVATNKPAFPLEIGALTVRQSVIGAPVTGKVIGSSVTTCQYVGSGHTLGDGASLCFGDYRFSRGSIEARGLVFSDSNYVMAVIGGTGLYSAVGGVLSVHDVGDSLHKSLLFELVAP